MCPEPNTLTNLLTENLDNFKKEFIIKLLVDRI